MQRLFPGECLASQHRLMLLDFWLKGQRRTATETRRPRTRWWSLRGQKLEMFKDKMLQQAGWALEGDSGHFEKGIIRDSWRVKGSISKETWWWNDEVHIIIKAEKGCFKKWQKNRNEDTYSRYKQACKEDKRAVTDAKMRACDDFYARLGSKDGEKNIYKLAKLGEKKFRDFSQVKCTKGDDSRCW